MSKTSKSTSQTKHCLIWGDPKECCGQWFRMLLINLVSTRNTPLSSSIAISRSFCTFNQCSFCAMITSIYRQIGVSHIRHGFLFDQLIVLLLLSLEFWRWKANMIRWEGPCLHRLNNNISNIGHQMFRIFQDMSRRGVETAWLNMRISNYLWHYFVVYTCKV